MRQLLHAIKFDNHFKEKDLCAIKVHVGEAGCKTFMDPLLIAEAVKVIKAAKAIPFITDTAVLYRSRRSNAPQHIELATEHGFDIEGTGAPFFPADGLFGTQEVVIPIPNCTHYQQVRIASAVIETTFLVVFSHVTGHLGTGMGATLKNLGMGCSSRKGKLSQHSTMTPKVKENKCTDCQECIEWCPENAISDPEGVAVIDKQLCIGCGQCLAVCRFDAIAYNWKVSANELQERMVEHAFGVLQRKRHSCIFFNIMVKMTKDCDCLGDAGKPVLPDIGILASTDPVAIDQAALDLIAAETGNPLASFAYPAITGEHQVCYAEKLGLGNRTYDLIDV